MIDIFEETKKSEEDNTVLNKKIDAKKNIMTKITSYNSVSVFCLKCVTVSGSHIKMFDLY